MMKSSRKQIYWGVLLMIAALSLFIRVYRFGIVPGGMNQDGAMAAVDAKALAEYGTDRFGMRYPVHLTAWGFGQMSALLSYLMAPMIKLFGLSVTSARLPQLLVSLASLAVLYLFARESEGRDFALTVFFFAAIDPWHIVQSRWALDCNLFPHFLLAGFFFLTRGAEGHRAGLYASMLFFALSMYCYGISIYTVPVLLAASCTLLLLRKKITLSQAVLCAGVYLLFAWPFLACMIINTLRLPTIETPFFTIPFFPNSMRSGDILFFSPAPLQQLGKNARSMLYILLQIYNGNVWNEVKGFGTLYVFSLPLTLAGMVYCFRQFRKSTGAALMVIWFCTALLAGLVTANVNINRINIIFYPLIWFTGAGICLFCVFCRRSRHFKAAAVGLPAVYLAAFGLFAYTYFTTYASQASAAFMQDFGNAVTAVKGIRAEKIYISPDAQYKGYAHVSEILTMFYLDADAKDIQSGAFSARYSFHIPDEPDPDEDAVYVAALEDLPRFDTQNYLFEPYGKFIVIKPE